MSIAVIDPFPMADATNQQQQRLPLRRAVYIHVSDLTNAYNIDHPKLEQELAKVKEGKEENSFPDEREIAFDLAPSGDGDISIASVPQQPKRRSLHPPRKGFNLCVLVGSVKVVVDKLRVDRSQVRLAEVEVGDETGSVSLRARDDQIEVLKEVSERSGAVVLRNCSVELFQGKHVRIAITKWGKLTPYPDQVASTPPPPSKINRDRNFSLIDMSLVAIEFMEISPLEAPFSPQSQYRMAENVGVGNRAPKPQPARQQVQQNRHDRKVAARDRRQQHTHPAKMNPSCAMLYSESGMRGHMGSMQYSGIPNYPPSFGEGHSHQASTQHLLMQQYEMHRRQLHQMQTFHEQQECNRSMMPRHHQQGHQLQGSILGAASFDTTGEYSVSAPVLGPGNPQQSIHLVGNNPMLIRVSMPGGQPSMGASGQPDHYGTRSGAVMSAQGAGMPQSSSISGGRQEAFRQYHDPLGSAHGGAFVSTQADAEGASTNAWGTPSSSDFVSQDDVSLSPGHMNPQATAFAPTFQDPRGEQRQMQSSAYGYISYDPAGTIYSAPQAPMYSQSVMYFPMTGTTGSTTPSEISPDVAASPSDSKDDHNLTPQAAPQDAPRNS